MRQVGALSFKQQVDAYNRYATVDCDPNIDNNWLIWINGTDNNGDRVFPNYINIDNYQNSHDISYNIDGITGNVSAYTRTTIEISPNQKTITVTLNNGNVTLWISEKRLPLSIGAKFTITPSLLLFVGDVSGNFICPDTWNSENNKIHIIGAGSNGANSAGVGNSGRAGAGAAYARLENVALVAGTSYPFVIGTANSGVDSFFINAGTLMAKSVAANSAVGALAAASVGDFKANGGNGQAGGAIDGTNGAGGAGGPNAPGLDGVLGNGGNGDGGITGGIGGIWGAAPNDGGEGITWSRPQLGTRIGPGGGGGGGKTAGTLTGGAGGNYGSGGGGGRDGGNGGLGKGGLLVVEWVP